MKILNLTMLLLTFVACSGQTTNSHVVKQHNKLDEINSASEIETILVSIDKDYSGFKVNSSLTFNDETNSSDSECQHYSDSLKIKPWTKGDFDGNGYTDLLVIGTWDNDHSVICIMDSGKNNFFIKRITRRHFQDCTFPVVAVIDSIPMIFNYHETYPVWRQDPVKTLNVDTLVFCFNDFIEYSKTTANHKIEKIEYSASGCYGNCPIFKMIINTDRSATFDAEKYNAVQGRFFATIDTANYNLLTNLLNFIDFATLDSSYAVSWTDDQGCILKITYDNGKLKTIDDYGLLGTYGLNRVYDIIFKLRATQKWKK